MLVVRGQNLNPHELLAAANQFGDPLHQHNTRFQLEECPEIHYISNQDKYEDGRRYIPGSGYHTDHSNAANPPKATILHAKSLPKTGGDTQFVNMARAFETLDIDIQKNALPALKLSMSINQAIVPESWWGLQKSVRLKLKKYFSPVNSNS